MPESTENVRPSTHLVKVLGVRAQVRVSGRRDEKIAQIAARQRGRVCRAQLRAAGISRGAISRLVNQHRLFPLRGGVFAVGHAATVELGAETAALLASPDGAVLSHHSAAALWDIAPGDGRVHVLVPDGACTRADGFILHRTRHLAPEDVRVHKGLPLTAPARTLLDQAETLTKRKLELAFDRALVARIMRLAEVSELLSRSPGRKGTRILRALLDHHRGPTLTRSRAEELFLELIRSAGLPQPKVNARTHGYEVDFYWPEQRVVVEIDGFRYHSTRRAFEHDHRKDRQLRSAGLTVLRFTYDQLRSEPYAVIAHLASALTAHQVATISAPSSREIATSTE